MCVCVCVCVWMCLLLRPKKTQSCAKRFPLHTMHQSHPHETLQVFQAPPAPTHTTPTKFLSRCSLLAESMKMAAITGNLERLLCLLAALSSCCVAGCVVWVGGVGGWWRVSPRAASVIDGDESSAVFGSAGRKEDRGESQALWFSKGSRLVGWLVLSQRPALPTT